MACAVNPLLPQNPCSDTVESFAYSQAHTRVPVNHPDIAEAVETMQKSTATEVFDRIRNAGEHVVWFTVERDGGRLQTWCRFQPLARWKKQNINEDWHWKFRYRFPNIYRLTAWARSPTPYDGPYDFKDTI